MIEFIIGGARSGKSKLAEQTARDSNKTVVYIATAQRWDSEMDDRIQRHRDTRPSEWETIEEPLALAQALKQQDTPNTVVLVDCLTLWVSNLLGEEEASRFEAEKKAFLTQLQNTQHSDIILVTNETGLGVVPMGQLSRRFVDESGWLHQDIAQLAHRVTFVVAGLPHVLKQ